MLRVGYHEAHAQRTVTHGNRTSELALRMTRERRHKAHAQMNFWACLDLRAPSQLRPPPLWPSAIPALKESIQLEALTERRFLYT
ncbi:hypothetical protein NDU88_000485 [Pleurodeles waltl]|uniref:Uncharacterized protein n=1 Tax=Pleurodeles waltl TaxID=8319 RepID=A0AAV7NCB9_PLEWA|nr:hypothetical protein NDU88_000485 [Pleurodeles waltl]